MSSNILDVPLHGDYNSTKTMSRGGSGYATPTHEREVAMIPRTTSLSLLDRQNRALSESVGRDRVIKEQKMLAQRKLVHFQEEEGELCLCIGCGM